MSEKFQPGGKNARTRNCEQDKEYHGKAVGAQSDSLSSGRPTLAKMLTGSFARGGVKVTVDYIFNENIIPVVVG
jgi:hypothetical protein